MWKTPSALPANLEFNSVKVVNSMFVYCILNLVNLKCYIGKANNPSARWVNHKWRASNESSYAVHCAIRKYGEESFLFYVVKEYNSEQEAYDGEVALIQQYGSTVDEWGYNMTKGGEGFSLCPSMRQKHLDVMTSAEHREKLSVAQKKLWQDPDFREKQIHSLSERRRTPQARHRQSEIFKELWATPGVMDNARVAMKSLIADPVKLKARNQSISEAYKTEEGRANKSAAMTKLWENDQYREKSSVSRKAHRNTPKAKARQAEINHARANTPEKVAIKIKIIELRELGVPVSKICVQTGRNRVYIYKVLKENSEKNKTDSG